MCPPQPPTCFPPYTSTRYVTHRGALEGSQRPARRPPPFPHRETGPGWHGDRPGSHGKFVSEEPGPWPLDPTPGPEPLSSCWTLIVQLITASPGLCSICVGTLCKHFLFGRAGNEGMMRSSDFAGLLLSCLSSRPHPSCPRPFPRLLSRSEGRPRGLGPPSPSAPGPGRPGVEPCSALPGWVLLSRLLNPSELPSPPLPSPLVPRAVVRIKGRHVGKAFGTDPDSPHHCFPNF